MNILLEAVGEKSALPKEAFEDNSVSFTALESETKDTSESSILLVSFFASTVEQQIDISTNNTAYSKCLVFRGSIG
ncbi:hypothetical protein [Flagellimonas sp. W118]|uniref:hypothetical protein n=1 Tax=Flagellimonas sp. W118 TaxID=3410791 RepID=UPI003BF59FDA